SQSRDCAGRAEHLAAAGTLAAILGFVYYASMIPPEMPQNFEPFVFVIVGASGDLTTRKLVPALYRLMERFDELRSCYLLGAARSEWSDEDFRADIRGALEEQGFS